MRIYRSRDCHVLRVSDEHIPALARIHAHCFDHGWSEDDLSLMLRGKGVDCNVVTLNGMELQTPKGFLILRTLGDQSEVLTIATDPKFRNRGVGRTLMEHAIRRLQGDRVKHLFLEVSEKNLAARKLYDSLNFKQISVRKSYYTNRSTANDHSDASNSNALVMQLELR